MDYLHPIDPFAMESKCDLRNRKMSDSDDDESEGMHITQQI